MDEPNISPEAAELLAKCRELFAEMQRVGGEQWDRTLPLGDYIVDRWDKARRLGFGKGSSIYDSSLVFGDVRVGENTWIGPFTILDGSGGGLTIGDHCSISAGVQIYTHDTVARDVSGHAAPTAEAPVTIGNRCYIGPQTVIARGVRIGDGCIIGAASLVLEDVPAGMKAYGSPCRVIGPADVDELKSYRAQRLSEQGDRA